MPDGVKILSQGEIVAASLLDYLRRHPEMERLITRGGTLELLTTEEADKFSGLATIFMGEPSTAMRVNDLSAPL